MDKEGKLTEAEKKKIAGWLEERWKGMDQKCPVCGDAGWAIADHLVLPLTLTPGGVQLGGVGYPQVMLISGKCGYTRFFNAPMMNLKVEEEKSQESPAPEQPKQSEGG